MKIIQIKPRSDGKLAVCLLINGRHFNKITNAEQVEKWKTQEREPIYHDDAPKPARQFY